MQNEKDTQNDFSKEALEYLKVEESEVLKPLFEPYDSNLMEAI